MPIRMLLLIAVATVLSACATPPSKSTATAPAAASAAASTETLHLDGVPATPDALREALQRYQSTRPASFVGWLPNEEGVLVSVRFGETAQLAKVTAMEGMRSQLTFFDEPVTTAVVSPNPEVNGALFLKDRGGNEYFQLHFLSFADLRTQLLSDGRSRNEAPVFARDGRRFAYSSTRRNSRDFDIWVGELGSEQAHRMVLSQGGSWYALDFSPDGRTLLLTHRLSATDARLHLLDLESGELSPIEFARGSSSEERAQFEPEGTHLLIATDALGEFTTLVRYDLASGVVQPLFTDESWDVEDFALSPDGRYLAVTRNIDGSSKVTIHERQQQLHESASIGLDFGVISGLGFNQAGTEIGFTISGPQVPGDVFSRRLASGTLSRWTRGETGGIDPASFVMPSLIRYGGHDTDENYFGLPRQIPSYYYQPPREGKAPVLVLIHGGPEAQSRPRFSDLIQYLTRELGIAVLVPNVRGSRGYGKTYMGLDDGRKREDSVQDIGSLLGWIGTREELDAERVAVYGGSYGGYMVLASMVHFSDRLRAGISSVGISNFVTFLENTNPYRVDQRRPEYGDERDPEMRAFLTSISPLTNADRITRPLFVIQGANDPRVPQSESEQILKAVRANGQEAWYMLARDEGHGFRKKANRDRMGEAISLFLQAHLLP